MTSNKILATPPARSPVGSALASTGQSSGALLSLASTDSFTAATSVLSRAKSVSLSPPPPRALGLSSGLATRSGDLEFATPPFNAGAIEAPQFRDVDFERRAVPMGGAELANHLRPALVQQMASESLDSLTYWNDFVSHVQACRAQQPAVTPQEAFASFGMDARERATPGSGGHCGALALRLLNGTAAARQGYIVGSDLPQAFHEAGVPVPGHGAALVPFANPNDKSDRGWILLEPGFNLPEPIVLRGATPVDYAHQGQQEHLRIYFEPRSNEIVFERRPFGKELSAEEVLAQRMTFRTDRFLNFDNSVTMAMVAVHQSPRIIGRDADGKFTAFLIVNLAKGRVEITVDGARTAPILFKDVDAEGACFAGVPGGAEALAAKLHVASPARLAERIRQVAMEEKSFSQLREQRLAHL